MKQELIDKTKQEILDKFGRENIESLLLIGSVARGEAVPESDIEFLAVMDRDAFRRVDSRLDKPKGNVSLGFTTKEHLKRFKPYIFTVETRKFGKVLWGDRHVLSHIPDYSYEDIDAIDGFILLNNRIVEQLILLKKIEDRRWKMENGGWIGRYEFDKGYIQLVNSYLAVNKRYKSRYPEKLAEFLKIYKGDAKFVAKAKEAFDSLWEPQQAVASKEEAMARWEELRGYFKEIWEYERRLLRPLRGLAMTEIKRILAMTRPKKIRQFLIYRAAAKEYFSEKPDLQKVKRIIKQWERLVK